MLERAADGSFDPVAGFDLASADGKHFELTTDAEETLDFELLPTTPPNARLVRYRRAHRVGIELAAASKIQAELGHDEPMPSASYRVDVEVETAPPELEARLRSGMLGNARSLCPARTPNHQSSAC